jgi:hypothetical protein
MKRGLIRWDRAELPASALESRLARVNSLLNARKLPALLVYSDVWRSSHARFLTNFMPYWNRSLILIPAGGAPVLLCGLSPRVYPWIRSVTVFDEIRPAAKLMTAMTQLCTERGWKSVGVLDLAQLPNEVYGPLTLCGIEPTNIPASEVISFDDAEFSMRRRAANMAREILAVELPKGAGRSDYALTGALERSLRTAGAEDAVILLSTGHTAPRPACGATLGDQYSVSLALEYCGHWVRVTRAHTTPENQDLLQERFRGALAVPTIADVETLSGPYPFESTHSADSPAIALTIETTIGGARLFFGDSCLGTDRGLELL